MKHLLTSIVNHLFNLIIVPLFNADVSILLILMPLVLFFEIPWTLFAFLGIIKYKLNRITERPRRPYFPPVSCIITCYSEGRDIEKTIVSLTEQIYPGSIQLIAVIDGASVNVATLEAAKAMEGWVNSQPNRSMLVLYKWQRGGLVSSNNLGRQFATGEIIMKMDGDSSFDNNMVERVTRHFEDETVAAVSGSLRVRNADDTLWASLQAIEYFISIHVSKTALSEFNMVNNISGAFGVFRREVLELVQGWDAGTAEDLDLTMRIKNYFAHTRKKFRIVFDPEAICFTDVPESLAKFLKQRIRWEGDYPFILYKHRQSISPRFFGWVNFLGMLINMFTQIAIPGMVFVYTIWLIVQYQFAFIAALLLAVYIFYCLLLAVYYLAGLILLSERKESDLSRIHLLPLVPLFLFIGRMNSFVAQLWELIGQGHKDSSMAPWWVLRKNKY